jgi:putative transposase
MPWKEVRPMDQKVLFIADYLRGGRTFAELCRLYGISRKTGYKWTNRYRAEGLDALQERSRTPHENPQRTPYAIRKAIIEMRKRFRIAFGPKKILALLAQQYPEWELPSRTTVYNILRTEGLIPPRRKRRRVAGYSEPFLCAHEPNDVWSADFKGQFMTGDGQWCYPLTVMDHQSRYLLCCRGLGGTKTVDVQTEFEKLFSKYGLPRRIRTDNGVPFASRGVGGLSRLSRWWVRLGILPERIEPGKPQQNGRHERMHKTLKEATAQPPGETAAHQQEIFDQFRHEYNNERPHEGLAQRPPASQYRTSERALPDTLPEPQYPSHYRVVPASSAGIIYCNGVCAYVGEALAKERVGLEEIDNGIWDVFFGPIRLGTFNERDRAKSSYGYLSLKV